jgi:hypothetical protein
MANDKYQQDKFERYSEQMGYGDFEEGESDEDGRTRYRNPNTQGRWNFWAASRDALASHTGEAEPVRECGNSECGWKGTTNRMLGSIGPLCPDCGETTEAAATPAAPGEGLLKEASQWLHAAYDRPPLTPECKDMLARVDAALSHPAPVAAPAPASEAVAVEALMYCMIENGFLPDNPDYDADMARAKIVAEWITKRATPSTGDSADAPVQQAPTDEQLSKAAYKGYDDYWTEDCAGKESEAWLACAKAVLDLFHPTQPNVVPREQEHAAKCPARDGYPCCCSSTSEAMPWDWLRGVINGLPGTTSDYRQLIARHDVLAWIDEGERRALKTAQTTALPGDKEAA